MSAAVEVFREKGYERATVRDIAARAGMTTSSLYSHVSSKRELFLAAVQPVIEQAAERMRRIAASDSPAAEKLRLAVVGAVSAFDTHYPVVSIYVREFYPVLETAEPELRTAYEQAWLAIVQEGVDSGEFRAGADARVVVSGILGMVNWMHRWYRPAGRRSAEEIGSELATLVLGGLESRPPHDHEAGRRGPREMGTALGAPRDCVAGDAPLDITRSPAPLPS